MFALTNVLRIINDFIFPIVDQTKTYILYVNIYTHAHDIYTHARYIHTHDKYTHDIYAVAVILVRSNEYRFEVTETYIMDNRQFASSFLMAYWYSLVKYTYKTH